jgi:hypothetical protein
MKTDLNCAFKAHYTKQDLRVPTSLEKERWSPSELDIVLRNLSAGSLDRIRRNHSFIDQNLEILGKTGGLDTRIVSKEIVDWWNFGEVLWHDYDTILVNNAAVVGINSALELEWWMTIYLSTFHKWFDQLRAIRHMTFTPEERNALEEFGDSLLLFGRDLSDLNEMVSGRKTPETRTRLKAAAGPRQTIALKIIQCFESYVGPVQSRESFTRHMLNLHIYESNDLFTDLAIMESDPAQSLLLREARKHTNRELGSHGTYASRVGKGTTTWTGIAEAGPIGYSPEGTGSEIKWVKVFDTKDFTESVPTKVESQSSSFSPFESFTKGAKIPYHSRPAGGTPHQPRSKGKGIADDSDSEESEASVTTITFGAYVADLTAQQEAFQQEAERDLLAIQAGIDSTPFLGGGSAKSLVFAGPDGGPLIKSTFPDFTEEQKKIKAQRTADLKAATEARQRKSASTSAPPKFKRTPGK